MSSNSNSRDTVMGGDEDIQAGPNDTVDSLNSERRVWLVKIPDFLADSFSDILENLHDSGESGIGKTFEREIGLVRLYNPTQDSPARVSVILNRENIEELRQYPKEYDMKFVKSQQKMHMFTESGEGRATAIEGRIEQECHLKPVLNDEYRAMLQQRTIEANRPNRTIQLVDSRSERVQVGLVPHVREMDLLNKRKQRLGEVDNRRERLPETEALNLIFRAFEKYSHWTLKGLAEHTQQPTIFIRDILNKVATYNTRGPYKNLYELRPEYKQ